MPKVAYSEAEKAQVREALLTKGLELLAKQGIQHTTVEQIYKAVGISRTFFYSFFLFRLFCGLGLLYFLLRYVLCHILGTILALCLWHCQVDLSACLVALIHLSLIHI